MDSKRNGAHPEIYWRLPVIVMVLAATMIPVELRDWKSANLSLDVDAWDVVANIAAYVPVGLVLVGCGLPKAIVAALSMTVLAESTQFFMVHREPSVIDVATNALGAVLGILVGLRWQITSLRSSLRSWTSLFACASASILALWTGIRSGDAPNPRGVLSPGILEAHWKLDEKSGRLFEDSSGHGLRGRSRHEPKRIEGSRGLAVQLAGPSDSIDFGHSSAFRLVGSMAISAWIHPTSFPFDDAAIVSTLKTLGYQLDTTIDLGPRTIGFKLADASGHLMARYGATPLVTNTWYHVAGVYNAESRTLDVYLNGQLDDGPLLGSVSECQRSSRESLYVGRRSNRKGFEFAGNISDVRVYSRPLTRSEILADMNGRDGPGPASGGPAGVNDAAPTGDIRSWTGRGACHRSSDSDDAQIPAAAVTLGVLVTIACAGRWPSMPSLACLALSLASGCLLLLCIPSDLPTFNLWLIPLISLAGGASVISSLRRPTDFEPEPV